MMKWFSTIGAPQSAPSTPKRTLKGINLNIRRRSKSMERKSEFAGVEHLSGFEADDEDVLLSDRQKLLIQEAWNGQKSKTSASAGRWIFRRLFSKHPEIKDVFGFGDLSWKKLCETERFRRHAHLFSDVLEMIVNTLGSHERSLGLLLASYGKKHVQFDQQFGFKAEYWNYFAEVMYEFSSTWRLSSNSKLETRQAWRSLIFFIVSKVRQGYVEEKTKISVPSDASDGNETL